jgi:4-hydroxybenzoate polyprenyltransferase
MMASASTNPTIQESKALPTSFATKIRQMLEMIRFSHSIFALPFACLSGLWAIAMSTGTTEVGTEVPFHGATSWMRWLGIFLCMVSARSFAMAWNRLVDADIDGLNPRTAKRHLPAGILRRTEVQIFAIANAAIFVASCSLFFPNPLPLALSVPVLIFLAGYSHAKRYVAWVHVWLGAALMLAPICAWIALRGEVVIADARDLLPALSVGLGVLFWVTGFDIIYACQDAEFDKQNGLFSLPAKLGVKNALRVAAVSHGVMVAVLCMTGLAFPQLSLGPIWFVSIAIIGCVLVVEHWLVSERDLTKVNIAFFNMNAVISIVLLLAGAVDAFWR